MERYKKIKFRWMDMDGVENEIETEELLSRAVQHEIDHLNGVLFIDHLSRLRRELLLNKIKKNMEKSL